MVSMRALVSLVATGPRLTGTAARPSDTHTVAALQAQNAKMLRVVAILHDAAGNATLAALRRRQVPRRATRARAALEDV